MYQALNLPQFEIKTRLHQGQQQVFDIIRKKYVALTPEEWVRQHFLNYLAVYRGYPLGLINVEFPVLVSGVQQRADIIAYSRDGLPLLVVECKAPMVKLNSDTFSQAARYNLMLKAQYLVVTNGIKHYCSKVDLQRSSFEALPEVPMFQQIG
ncbi:MAG TPA: type I restriction enzyme HsdR N-terminal domain-containing protein [Tenuifilaceae bacterium]|nr:type I restriction enzyme HsdR N-terminal domain-containing protein [Tenuifilaceae bacterium]